MPRSLPAAWLARYGASRMYLLIGAGMVALVVTIVSAILTLRSINDDTTMVEETLAVEASINRLSGVNERLETARRGFLLKPDAEFITIITAAQTEFDRELEKLLGATSASRLQQQRLAEIGKAHERRRPIVMATLMNPATSLAVVRSRGIAREEGTIIGRQIRRLTAEMRETEAATLVVRNRTQLETLKRFYLISGVALTMLIIVTAAVFVLITRSNRDLTRARSLLQTANEGLEDAVAKRTAELTRANDEIQRFAYIVSHDLRSPLVNVLGFTAELEMTGKDIRKYLETLFADRPELRDELVWRAVTDDLPEATGFIRTSTEKMDRLINSILDLSRQGRRVLSPELLDMTTLIQGIASTLHQRAEDAGAVISVDPLPELVSDRIAIEQVFSNLLENALKYLAPGRPGAVRVTGQQRGVQITIDVIDNGRGIAPEDHERIFELFRRAGTQDQAGEGIGLANVRALAYRLGGTVTVDSTLGEGSRFRVTLPQTLQLVEEQA